MIDEINEWTMSGNKVLSPDGLVLLIRPRIEDADGFVYPAKLVNGVYHPDKGRVVFKEQPSFLLEDHTMAFKEDGKRTVNRLFEKVDGEINRALDIRLWSMVFWVGVARAIEISRRN
ncbi:MAG: hypothetical protein AAFQ60_05760 [Pseudomonadota bacterium]